MIFRMVLAAATLTALTAPALAQDAPAPGGTAEWLETGQGQLKSRVYASAQSGEHPVLVVFLHGDVPDPQLNYHYYFSRLTAAGEPAIAGSPQQFQDMLGPEFAAWMRDNWRASGLVAAGITRPGYSDEDGDTSDGTMGMALADNYTPEVVDAVAAAIEALRAEYSASAIVLVGHSGGAAIAANVLGRHPDIVDGALLIACGCDPVGWRAVAREGLLPDQPWLKDLDWDHPYNSLSPLDTASGVAPGTKVRMVIGENDAVVELNDTTEYAALLEARDVDVTVTVVPGYDHNGVVFSQPVFEALGGLIAEVRAGAGQ